MVHNPVLIIQSYKWDSSNRNVFYSNEIVLLTL